MIAEVVAQFQQPNRDRRCGQKLMLDTPIVTAGYRDHRDCARQGRPLKLALTMNDTAEASRWSEVRPVGTILKIACTQQ
jgi:hypothetical protein